MELVTPDDLAVLDEATPQRLAEMYCLLNTWLWPRELPDPEQPIWTPITKGSPPTNLRRSALMKEIQSRPGVDTITEWNSRANGKKRGRGKYQKPIDKSLNYLDQQMEYLK